MTSCFSIIYQYMTSFAIITPEEYKKLVANEKKNI